MLSLEQTTTITVVDVPFGRSNNSIIDIVNVSEEKHVSFLAIIFCFVLFFSLDFETHVGSFQKEKL